MGTYPRVADRKALGLEWPDYDIYKINEWARLYGVVPSAMDWNVAMAHRAADPERLATILQRQEEQLWPNASTVTSHFGSWNKAIIAAGFVPRGPGERHWEDPVPVDPPPQELLDRIAELWQQDALWQDRAGGLAVIGRVVGLSPGVVLSHVNRLREQGVELTERELKLPLKPTTHSLAKDKRQRLIELSRAGWSPTSIAEEIGLARSTVYSYISRLRAEGVELPYAEGRPRGRPVKQLKPDELQVVFMLQDNHWPIKRIAEAIGYTVQQVEHSIAMERKRRDALVVRRARVRVMSHAGVPVEEIARRLDIPVAAVEGDLQGELEQDPVEAPGKLREGWVA